MEARESADEISLIIARKKANLFFLVLRIKKFEGTLEEKNKCRKNGIRRFAKNCWF
jgi:hypothetical protein